MTDPMKSGWVILLLLLMVSLWAGCTTSQVQFARQTKTTIEARETVAILISTESPLENDAVTCISDALRNARPGVRVITPDEFRRNIFYYGYPDNDDERRRYFTLLANEPALRERIAKLGLRYVVSLHGGTEQHGEPLLGAAGGGGAAITWFGMSWDRKSRLEASVYDLKQVVEAGTIRALAEGRPWFLCVGMGPFCVPMGAATFTESKSCTGLGAAVATFLTGGNLPESANSTDRPKE